jgi:hypothetical protein
MEFLRSTVVRFGGPVGLLHAQFSQSASQVAEFMLAEIK